MERLTTAILAGFVRTLALLSLPAQRQLGRLLGTLAWKLRLDATRVTRINLAQCFPEMSRDDRERLVRASLEETAQVLAEVGVIFQWPEARWSELAISVEGEDLVTRALDEGRGVLVLVPHLGNWEYLSLYLGNYRVTALYDPHRSSALENVIHRARSRAGARLFPIGRSGIKAVYSALATGGLVALLPDQVPDRASGVYADFFRKPALTMTLAWRLILRTRPLVLFGVALRVNGGFAIRFSEATADIYAADAVRAVQAMNRSIEQLVRERPEQYQWEYKRFKRPPPGDADCYRRAARQH